jgi:hypothetical protein
VDPRPRILPSREQPRLNPAFDEFARQEQLVTRLSVLNVLSAVLYVGRPFQAPSFIFEQSRQAEYDRPTALPRWVRTRGNCPVVDHYALAMTAQQKSLVKLDVRAAS